MRAEALAGLTTHVLDTSRGRPAAGLRIDFSVVEPDGRTRLIKTVMTNADGRSETPLLAPSEMKIGCYELVFHVAAYFRASGMALPDPPFLDQVPVRFAIAEPAAHYHVPLLVSPYGYVTYRGS
jgi:5-hydroxyisourate hydrolase